jgi:hypothetical protein
MNQKNKADHIDYLYNFTKKNIQGPSNVEGTMFKGENGTLEEVLTRIPLYEYPIGILWPHIVYKSEKELEQASFEKGGKNLNENDNEDANKSIKVNQKVKNRIEKKSTIINEEDSIDSEEENLINLAHQRNQCAMGISFRPKVGSDLEVDIFAALYIEDEVKKELSEQSSKFLKIFIDKKKVWYRKSIGDKKVIIKNNQFPKNIGDQVKRYVLGKESDPELIFILRKLSNTVYTGYLFNQKDGMKDNDKTTSCFFQVEFKVKSSKGFEPYTKDNPLNKTKGEVSNFELLYSDFPAYSIGHGCSPIWDDENPEKDVTEIMATHMPRSEVKPVKAKPLIIENKEVKLSMELLSKKEKKSDIIILLERFIKTYSEWIKEKVKESDNLDTMKKVRAKKNLINCDISFNRMKNGIKALKENDSIFESFCYMNQAMLLQQIRYNAELWEMTDKEKSRPLAIIEDRTTWPDWSQEDQINKKLGNWRPFQLAFILMNLTSLSSELNAKEAQEEREIVDLIWFPTGGGKTEAYFGIAAFNIFSRRLNNKNDHATTVITRYTYRVLTTQQFERTAALITSCDIIRKKNQNKLGEQPIDLGLWIGKTSSHQTIKGSIENYHAIWNEKKKNLKKPYTKEHRFPLQSCPCCRVSFFKNRTMTGLGIKKEKGGVGKKSRIEYQCPNQLCNYYKKKIPVSAIDEELYQKPPTFLIGTVDKFALLPYRKRARVFFGLNDQKIGTPPDLIIQDELHLISGPLGSIYGIYERLISELILKAGERKNLKPKIVCSTATINSANDQIQKLYGIKNKKKINIFPSNAIKIWDNFFSEIDNKNKGRTYMGIIPPLTTDAVSIKRYYMSSLLQAGKNLEQDAYWTIIDYYSSLRDLGVGYSTATSDVFDQLSGFEKKYTLNKEQVRKLNLHPNSIVELTGRDPSQSIPQKLNDLSVKYDKNNNLAIDICLTTNMFSVGVDIPRLGLMFLNSQTKTSSEYIQATSRVGRSDPGLVAVQYASSRPRDKSYYEQFQAYHTRFYSHVEPTSVTPFSFRVIDKVLPAIIIGFIRLIKNYEKQDPKVLSEKDFNECKSFIEGFSSLCENKKEANYIISRADEIMDTILFNKGNYHEFYSFQVQSDAKDIIYPEGLDFKKHSSISFSAPISMRDVDSESSAELFYLPYKKTAYKE